MTMVGVPACMCMASTPSDSNLPLRRHLSACEVGGAMRLVERLPLRFALWLDAADSVIESSPPPPHLTPMHSRVPELYG